MANSDKYNKEKAGKDFSPPPLFKDSPSYAYMFATEKGNF